MSRENEPRSECRLLAEAAYFGNDAVGNRTTLVAPAGEVSYYGYDALDRLAWLRADAFGTDAATYYSYDTVGNRTGLTDAELHTTSFAYDALRRLLHEQDALGKTEYYGYDAVGNLAHRTNGDGQTTYFSYDAFDRRTEVAFPEGFNAYFGYDEVGNLTSASDTHETDDFAYDALNRVAPRLVGELDTSPTELPDPLVDRSPGHREDPGFFRCVPSMFDRLGGESPHPILMNDPLWLMARVAAPKQFATHGSDALRRLPHP